MMSVSHQPDPDWYGYECKPGQILFYYNKTTGEHIWAGGDVVSYTIDPPDKSLSNR